MNAVLEETKRLEALKNLVWNILMYVFALLLLVVSCYFGSRLLRDGQSVEEQLKILVVVLGIPAFVVVVAWDRLPRETVGAILAAVIGYAIGKIG